MRKIVQIATSFTAEGACLFALDSDGTVWQLDRSTGWEKIKALPQPHENQKTNHFAEQRAREFEKLMQEDREITVDDVPF